MNQKNVLAYISFFASKAGNLIALIYFRQLSVDKLVDNSCMTIRWKPSATVAAIIEQNGKFLLVEEHTPEGLQLNNPAGHLDEGEGLVEACAREALEETTHTFQPTNLIGVYTSRFIRPAQGKRLKQDVTYLRFAFCGTLGPLQPERKLDTGIVRTLWLTPDEIRASADRHRSPLVVRCMDDYLTGRRFPLDMIHTDQSVTALRAQAERT